MLQPGEQAFLVLVGAVFLIFSAVLAYATYLGGESQDSEKSKKK